MSNVQELIQEYNYLPISALITSKQLVDITNTLTEAMVKKNDPEEKLKLKKVIETKQIKFLLHFTPISNLENMNY